MSNNNLKPNNYLEKFVNTIPGKSDVPKDIDCKIVNSGDFQVLEGIDAIVIGILRILLISKGTYIFNPEFGLGLYKYIFELQDEVTKTTIEDEIKYMLNTYENRCSINVNVQFLKNIKGFVINLDIKYQGEKKKVSVQIDENILRTLQEKQ
jgi:phage baseplate assembly protein W